MAYDPPLPWSGMELPDLSTDPAWDAARVKQLFEQLEAAGAALYTRLDVFTEWADYAPTWTNLTVGNGIQVAKWRKSGAMVQVYIALKFGTTTTIASNPMMSLPLPPAAWFTNAGPETHPEVTTGGIYEDVSNGPAGRFKASVVYDQAISAVRLGSLDPSVNARVRWIAIGPNDPFAWSNAAGNVDLFSFSLEYPAAS